MLRQLDRLMRRVPAAGHRAAALAVYAGADDRAIAAAETGFEGVACVDDAARAVVVYCDLWERTRSVECRSRAEALLDFVLYMEDGGRFVNFIHDWDGTRNVQGPTSHPGGPFWQARALCAVAKAAAVLGDPRAAAAAKRALPHVPREIGGDVRAVDALAAIDLGRTDLLETWCDEIKACRQGDVLVDHPEQQEPHLWAHLQEGVLAEAGALLQRRDLVEAARRSAEIVFVPIIETAFDQPRIEPDAVASAVYAMDRLAAATGDPRYRDLAAHARAWFDGRNAAREPVYDRSLGRVADGIDDGRVNRNSGAEANIVAAKTLVEELAARLLLSESACFLAARSERVS